MKRLLNYAVLFRIYIVLVAGLYGITALFQPETLVYQVAHADAFSEFVMLGLCALAVFSAFDVIINDVLPEPFVMRTALHDRHLLNMAIAGCFATQMWTCAKYGFDKSVLPFYGLQVLLIPISAFTDVQKRYRLKHQ